VGLGRSNSARGITVDSSASGSYVSVAPVAWLKNNFPLVASTQDLVEPFPLATLPVASPLARTDSKGYVVNLAARRFTNLL
jgi:hypothetical protein